MLRTDIINILIQKFGYKSYLEIGTQRPAGNFDKINAINKVCVEPFPSPLDADKITFIGTSDEYFKSISDDVKFDIIFIDGLHHSDQVLVDIENSLMHLSENGTIVCHDCLPHSEVMQRRDDHGGEWTGDVWKAIAQLRIDSLDLHIQVVDTDYGCGIIRRGTNIPYLLAEFETYWKTYLYYQSNRNRLMNVVSIDEFMKWINSIQ